MMRPEGALRILLWLVTLTWIAGGPLHADAAAAPGEKPPATMRDPGPDLGGNFPNGAGVVPVGRFYLETGIGYQTTSRPRVDDFVLGVLLRAGIVPRLELRFGGAAVNSVDQPGGKTTGAGPVQLGMKYEIAGKRTDSYLPRIGFEFQLQVPIASADFDNGVILPSFSFNFDHLLPAGYSFNWNLDICSDTDAQGDLFAQGNFQWSFGRSLGEDFNLFVTGYALKPATKPEGGTNSVAGLGFLWYPSDRTSFQLTAAWGLTELSPDWAVLLSVAFAF